VREEFLEYIFHVVDHFSFWLGGVALLAVEIFKKTRWKEWAERLRWEFWLVAGVCIFVATFQTWHEEKGKAKEGAVFVRPAGITPKRAGITNPDIFPVGEKASVNVRWTVLGQKPALNAMQPGQVYLADDDKS
jgi:hypothetical protein